MDRVQKNKLTDFRIERLQTKWSDQHRRILKKLEAADTDCNHSVKKSQLKFDLTGEDEHKLAPHLLRFIETCGDYLMMIGTPGEISDFYERVHKWLSKLDKISKEMRADGLEYEPDQLIEVASLLVKKSSSGFRD